MTLLCIAVQNSQTMIGVFEGPALRDSWRVSTDDRRTSDDWGLLVLSLLSQRDQLGAPVDGVCVCSAVPAALHQLRATVADYLPEARTVVIGPGVRSGLPVLTDNPREVGTDRIANAVAAVELFGAPCIVVGFGTATTFDVVNRAGQYVGGAIAAGIQLSVEALGSRGAQLRQVELSAPRSVIATNTVEALQAGAVFGTAGQVDGIVGRITTELTGDRAGRRTASRAPASDRDDTVIPVVATGELAGLVAEHCVSVTSQRPWLTLEGMRLIFERNC
jgi:type III pantothenate kinase